MIFRPHRRTPGRIAVRRTQMRPIVTEGVAWCVGRSEKIRHELYECDGGSHCTLLLWRPIVMGRPLYVTPVVSIFFLSFFLLLFFLA